MTLPTNELDIFIHLFWCFKISHPIYNNVILISISNFSLLVYLTITNFYIDFVSCTLQNPFARSSVFHFVNSIGFSTKIPCCLQWKLPLKYGCLLFIFLVLCWLEVPEQCWIKVVRAGILVFHLLLGGKHLGCYM